MRPDESQTSSSASLDSLLCDALGACEQAMAVVDVGQPSHPLVWVNPAYERLTGYRQSELLGRNPRFLQVDDGDASARQRLRDAIAQGLPAAATLLNRRKDGSLFLNHVRISPLPSESARPRHYVGLAHCLGEPEHTQPVGANGESREQLLHQSLQQALEHALATGSRFALLLIQVAGAKASAHAAGRLMAEQLAGQSIPNGAKLLQLSEQDSAIVLDPAPPIETLVGLAQDLREALRDRGAEHCAVGVSLYPGDGQSAVELQAAAKQALARATQRSPAGGLSFFGSAHQEQWHLGHQLQQDLRQALASPEPQFHLQYQPLIELDGGWMVGMEALLRWEHPERGCIGPDTFIPVAEASGLICELGDWVLETALVELKKVDRLTPRPLRMAVNVSAQQLRQAGFAARIQALLQRHAIAPSQLELEITERCVTVGDKAIEACLHELRRLNVRLAIDDFGTGYANLQGLTLLPVDVLKIDRSLTQSAVQSGSALSVARMVCELARALHMQVVAEGIETATELALFRRFGATYGQGFLISHPIDAEALHALVQRQLPLASEPEQENLPHLLLLDDEAHIISALKRSFRREPWRVHGTTSPEEAMRLLAQHPVGVVICDQRMPEMNGTEFFRQVRLSHPKVVRVLLSGYSEISAVTAAINEGAVWKVLSKPWDDEDLRQQVRLAFDLFRQSTETERQQREADQRAEALRLQLQDLQDRLARKIAALAATRAWLLELPVALLGLDPLETIVFSNDAADRLFGEARPLIGASLRACLPEALAALALEGGQLDWHGQRYRVHVQPMPEQAGRLLCLIPSHG